MRRAGIERSITDPYSDPLLNPREALGKNYDAVLRINAFARGRYPETRDHNGNSAHILLDRLGLEARTFDDYVAALERVVDGCSLRNHVGLKNALAYYRDLVFDEPNEGLARQAWGKPSPSLAEQRRLAISLSTGSAGSAGERDLPMQMHLGTAIIRGSHPMQIAGLLERHPRTRFLLMYLAYPWSQDLLGMAFVYRNIWLDLTWSLLLSPSHFKVAHCTRP